MDEKIDQRSTCKCGKKYMQTRDGMCNDCLLMELNRAERERDEQLINGRRMAETMYANLDVNDPEYFEKKRKLVGMLNPYNF